jgi:DNA-binding MarR family transcriptional regulator
MVNNTRIPRLQVSILQNVTERSFLNALKDSHPGITMAQELVLRALRFEGDMNQTELASRVGQDRNNLSRTLGILEKKSLISKRINEEDRRYLLVSITPTGKKVHEEIFEVMETWREKVYFKGIEPEELESFNITFMKLINNLQNSRMDEK